MRYIAYCRKSSEDDSRQVQSLETQERNLLDYALKNNLQVVEVIKESKSAKVDNNRPQFDRMLEMIEKGEADAILIHHIDRLSRNGIESGKITKLFEQGKIKEIRTPFKSINSLYELMYLDFEFIFSSQYSRNLSIRTKEGLETKLLKGEYPGCGPLGYINRDGRIYPDPIKCVLVKKAFELYSTGDYSLKGLANYLFDLGLRTRGGNKVHKSQLNITFRNPCFYGAILCKGVLYKGIHEPLVSKQLFDRVNAILDGKNRSKKQKHNFLYRGYANCAVCGCMLTASFKRNKHTYYYCTNGKRICNQNKKYLKEQEFHELIQELMDTVILDKEMANLSLEIYAEELRKTDSDKVNSKNLINDQLKTINKKLNVLLDRHLEGLIDTDTFKNKQKELLEEKTDLELSINYASNDTADSTLERLKKIKNQTFDLGEMYRYGNDEVRKDLLKSVLWNVKIKDKIIASKQYNLPYALFEKLGKNANIQEWLRVWNDVGTYFVNL